MNFSLRNEQTRFHYQCTRLSRVDVVEMVLDELYGGAEVGLIELVRDVPADWSKLPAFLHGRVEEGDAVQHRLPLHHVGDVQ